MTRVITSACIGTKDTSCVDVCPTDAIHPHSGDGEGDYKATLESTDQLFINPDECIDCGACESACPVSAIYPDDEVPDDQQGFIAKNEEFFS